MFNNVKGRNKKKAAAATGTETPLFLMDEVTLRNARNSGTQFVELFNYFQAEVQSADIGWKIFEQWQDAKGVPGKFTNLWTIPDANALVLALDSLREQSQYVELVQACVQSEHQNLLENLMLAVQPPTLKATDEYLVLRQDLQFKVWNDDALDGLTRYALDCHAAGGQLMASAIYLTGHPGEVLNLWAVTNATVVQSFPPLFGELAQWLERSEETLQSHVTPSNWKPTGH